MKSKKVAVLSLCGLFLFVSLSAFYFLNSEEKMSGKKIKSQLMKLVMGRVMNRIFLQRIQDNKMKKQLKTMKMNYLSLFLVIMMYLTN